MFTLRRLVEYFRFVDVRHQLLAAKKKKKRIVSVVCSANKLLDFMLKIVGAMSTCPETARVVSKV